MDAAKPAISFDEIINRGRPSVFVSTPQARTTDGIRLAGRQRREHEAMAQEIFGKNRRSSETGRNVEKKTAQTPSLASRTGIAKV
jgi:hypothetical protein